jgi:predicted amidophosphoribosyltransferase
MPRIIVKNIIRTFSINKRPPLFVFPICAECVNYVKSSPDLLSRCKKQSYYNNKTDELEYEYADYVRRNRTVCGYEGIAFESIYTSKLSNPPSKSVV